MPTQTFWNLPPHKREALIAVAIEEFANHDYNDASISRIVQQAGIAKGSIYQYFADKRDLFLFLVDLSNQKRLEYVQSEPPPEPDMSFWQTLRWQIGASTRAALAYPLLTRLFGRAMSGALPFHDEIVGRMKALANAHWRSFVQRGIEGGDIDPAVDPDLAALLLSATFNDLGPYIMQRLEIDNAALHELDVARFQTPEVDRIFDDMIRMLERGIGRSS
jgi:AcrR family transcriptional regulator